MPRPIKKWKLVYPGADVDDDVFTSQKDARQYVEALTRTYAADPAGTTRTIEVWELSRQGRDGWDWRKTQTLDLAELAAPADA